MDNKKLYIGIIKALKTMQTQFGDEVFNNPSRFVAGINDIVPASEKTTKHLLRIAICEVHAFSRLKQASDNKDFIARHLESEMVKDYMIPQDIAWGVVECIAAFVGFKISEKPIPTAPASAVSAPTEKEKPKRTLIKPKPLIKIPPPAIITTTMRHSRLDVVSAPASKSPALHYDHNPRAGSTITFGGRNWLVLEVKGKKGLLLSESIIETRWYHDVERRINWDSCSLRKYLNSNFYDKFSKEEKSRIAKTKLKNTRNPWFGTKGGGDTTDKIFLLCISEVIKYFGDSQQLRRRPPNIGHIDDQFNNSRIATDLQ